MPYTAYYFNSQLNEHLGLQPNYLIRALLQKMVYLETRMLKLHAIQSNWDNNRAIIVRQRVIENMKSTRIMDHEIGIRHHSTNKATPSHVVIRRMERALDWYRSQPHYLNTMKCCFPDMGEVSWFCIDQSTGDIDRNVSTRNDYFHDWRARGMFPSKSDTSRGDPYSKHRTSSLRHASNMDRRVHSRPRPIDVEGYSPRKDQVYRRQRYTSMHDADAACNRE